MVSFGPKLKDHREQKGGGAVVELVFRIECARQAVADRLLRRFGELDHSFLGIAALVFFIALYPVIIAPPVAVAEVPPAAVVVGALILLGFVCMATIILAPLGFVFF